MTTPVYKWSLKARYKFYRLCGHNVWRAANLAVPVWWMIVTVAALAFAYAIVIKSAIGG